MHSEVKSEAWVEDKVTQVEAKTAKTTWANIIKNDVEVETAEKTQGEKAACHQHLGPQDRSPTSSRTKPPRSAPTINFFKNIDVETAEEDQVVRAVKTKQNAESELAINTWSYIIEHRTSDKFENFEENTNEVAASN